MPKYMMLATYTADGVKGLISDSASGRKADVQAAVKALGGHIEAFYYALGPYDVVSIVDLPSSVSAAAFSLTTAGSGAVRVETVPLLSVEEVDQALELQPKYRAPGVS